MNDRISKPHTLSLLSQTDGLSQPQTLMETPHDILVHLCMCVVTWLETRRRASANTEQRNRMGGQARVEGASRWKGHRPSLRPQPPG